MKNLYTEKTKMLAVEKVLRFGEKECKVAKELGINEESLKKWIDSEKKAHSYQKIYTSLNY
ncbi:transposase [Pseudoalteromonas sp. Hal040]|uniref:transposase n=1 Tax=Pseudoalteromonas sp. Hal040 TaxID=3035157 RepID=UPI00301B9F35